MSTTFEVDQFTSQQSRDEFMGRYDAIDRTVEALGLCGLNSSEGPAVAFGGGTLTKFFFDSYIPGRVGFDLDVIVSATMFARLKEEGLMQEGSRKFKKHGLQGVIQPSKPSLLKVDVITSEDPEELEKFLGDEPYTGTPNHSVKDMGGLYVVWPGVAAKRKVMYERDTRVKDLGGVVKAHVVAAHMGHPLLKDPKWEDAVSHAVDRLLDGRVWTPRMRRAVGLGPKYPRWLRQLIKAEFEHPAFAGIPEYQGQ